MFQKILFASDLTEASDQALRIALDLGRRFSVPVLALHVAEPSYYLRPFFAPLTAGEIELLQGLDRREGEAARAALEQKIAGEHEGAIRKGEAQVIIRHGIPADVIPATAQDLGAGLIVMGTHGRRGYHHALLGSVAERVARTAACPVLTVRAQATP